MLSKPEKPLVSIIIRTKNEERWIAHCLKSVFNQTHDNIEVILVDNQSTDLTVKKAQQYPVKVVTIDQFRPGEAINIGIKVSSGEIISVLSGHCIPTSNQWLENLISELEDVTVAGVYGRQEPLAFSSALDKRDLMLVFGLDRKVQHKDSFFHNANSAFTRATWDQFPFDETVTNIEDRIWGNQVIAAGKKIIYEPEASVFHWHGIHHALDSDRANNIVRILESFDEFSSKSILDFDKEIEKKSVALIPIKGLSPTFSGRPLLAWTLDCIRESGVVEQIIVCPDNVETRNLAVSLGAQVPFLRDELYSQDIVSTLDVVRHCLAHLEGQNFIPDVVVYADETYPFRSPNLLREMMQQFINSDLDSLVAAVREKRGIWIEEDDEFTMVSGSFEPAAIRSKTAFVGAPGLCLIARPDVIRGGDVFGAATGIFEVADHMSSVQVKDSSDCRTMEPYFEAWNHEHVNK